MTEIDPLMVLEARNLKAVYWSETKVSAGLCCLQSS